MNSTWSTTVTRRPNMDLISLGSDSFKTFLPYEGVFKVTDGSSGGVEGMKVELCVDATYETANQTPKQRRPSTSERHCDVRVSDEKGFVRYQLLSTEPNLNEFNVKVLPRILKIPHRISLLFKEWKQSFRILKTTQRSPQQSETVPNHLQLNPAAHWISLD